MTARDRIGAGWRAVERWFTAPEADAAGRMGIFRILFAVFYLWHLSVFDLTDIAGMPPAYRRNAIRLFDLLPQSPSATQLRLLDGVLVAALALLALGVRTRLTTAVVLVAGVIREALLAGLSVENANLFLVFYLPLFMLVAGTWGDTYSVDARRRRVSGSEVSPSDDSWPHFLAARVTLVLLALLFATSPAFKTMSGGTWLSQTDLLSNLMLEKNVTLAEAGLAGNPLAPWIADHPPVGFGLQLAVLAFEALFLLVLFGRDLRTFFLASAVVFHGLNAFVLGVTFTPILIVYAMFVNWEGLLRRVRPRRPERAPSAGSATTSTVAAVGLALLLAVTWRAGAHHVFDLGGLLDWRTMMMPVVPVAFACAVLSAVRIVRRVRPSSPRQPAPV